MKEKPPSPNPYVVNQLQLERHEHGHVYQLTHDSVSPMRVIGRDKHGLPIEETVCTLAKSARFVNPGGNICDVALRTGRVYSVEPEAERYEMIVLKDQLLAGSLPLAECPFTMDYKNVVGGPLVKPENGETDCGGKPDGCEHLWPIIEARRKANHAKWKAQQDAFNAMTPGEAVALLQNLSRALDMVQEEADEPKPSPPSAVRAGRSNLVRGQGEK